MTAAIDCLMVVWRRHFVCSEQWNEKIRLPAAYRSSRRGHLQNKKNYPASAREASVHWNIVVTGTPLASQFVSIANRLFVDSKKEHAQFVIIIVLRWRANRNLSKKRIFCIVSIWFRGSVKPPICEFRSYTGFNIFCHVVRFSDASFWLCVSVKDYL